MEALVDKSFVLQIRNFQRVKKANLKFVPGLNCIVGESNNGKSSCQRALRAAIFNSSKESQTTLGETRTAIGIRYNGHEVIFRRDNDAASPVSYRVDGKILTKIGRKQPEIIADCLGIREVDLDDFKIKPNFQKQMEYPFLLDKTPSQLFKFIMQSAEEDNVMDVVQTMKTDLNQIKVNVKAYEEARESLRIVAQREISRYKEKLPAVEYCDRVLGLESSVKRLDSLTRLVEQCKELTKTIVESTEDLKKVTKQEEYLNKRVGSLTVKIDRLLGLDSLIIEQKARLDDFYKKRTVYREQQKKLKTYDGLDEYSDRVQELSNKKRVYSDLTKLAFDITNYQDKQKTVIKSLSLIDGVIAEYGTVIGLLDRLVFISDIVSECSKNKETLKSVEGSIFEINNELVSIESTINEFDVCPFCGSVLGEDHVHD